MRDKALRTFGGKGSGDPLEQKKRKKKETVSVLETNRARNLSKCAVGERISDPGGVVGMSVVGGLTSALDV